VFAINHLKHTQTVALDALSYIYIYIYSSPRVMDRGPSPRPTGPTQPIDWARHVPHTPPMHAFVPRGPAWPTHVAHFRVLVIENGRANHEND
jgi:hypothetical protein